MLDALISNKIINITQFYRINDDIKSRIIFTRLYHSYACLTAYDLEQQARYQ